MIPAYSPRARAAVSGDFGTWQGRLPQEFRLAGISSVEAANRFLRKHYIAEFNRRFQVAAAQAGNAFLPCRGCDLDLVFALQFERSVTATTRSAFANLCLQFEQIGWWATLAGCQECISI